MKNLKLTREKPARQEEVCYCLFSEEASVQKVLSLLPEYENTAEVWTELNVAELKLTNGAMFWEAAAEDFSAEEDQRYIQEHGIRCIYAVTFDVKDHDEAQKILNTVFGQLGGRICSDEEVL